MLVQGDNIVPDVLFPLQPHRRPLYEWLGASLYEWQGVGLIVLAGVDLSPPDGAAMQMSTCPLCSLLAPARDGVPRKELEFSLKQAVHMQWKGSFQKIIIRIRNRERT